MPAINNPDWTDMMEELETDYDAEDVGSGEWIVLYPEDFQSYMKDEAGNLAVRVDARQIVEINRLTVRAFEEIVDE